MWASLRHKELYLLVLILGLVITVTALGGGLFNQSGPWFDQWQHKAFIGLCHQDPQRSFWLNGSPMAICTRCLGIYSSFTVLWILFPLHTVWLDPIKKRAKAILLGVILINVIDVIGNSLGFWTNTLPSRYFMGAIIGVAAALILSCGFVGKQQHKEKHHGTVRTYH